MKTTPNLFGGCFFTINWLLFYLQIMFIFNKKLLFFLAFFIVILGTIVFKYFINDNSDFLPQKDQNTNPDTIDEDSAIKSNLPVGKIPKYTGRPLDEVVFGKGFTDPGGNFVEKKRSDLKVLSAVLNANPMGTGGVDDWIAVGVFKKSFYDYIGARDAWEYAGVLYPDNALSFANLGNLYGFYLYNNIKAELNYKKSITNDPYQTSYYLGLADFYKSVYTAKKLEAPKVLLEGIGTIKDVNLVLSLATYYRDIGDKANAVKYYEEVLKMEPNTVGIQDEINLLK